MNRNQTAITAHCNGCNKNVDVDTVGMVFQVGGQLCYDCHYGSHMADQIRSEDRQPTMDEMDEVDEADYDDCFGSVDEADFPELEEEADYADCDSYEDDGRYDDCDEYAF